MWLSPKFETPDQEQHISGGKTLKLKLLNVCNPNPKYFSLSHTHYLFHFERGLVAQIRVSWNDKIANQISKSKGMKEEKFFFSKLTR